MKFMTTLTATAIAAALAFGATTASAQDATAAQQEYENPNFDTIIREYLASWTGFETTPEAPEIFFVTNGEERVFDPLVPFEGYTTWESFQETVESLQFQSQLYTLDPESLEVTRSGDVIWTAAFFSIENVLPDGSLLEGDARQTAVWIWQDDAWRIVQKHESMPVGEGGMPFLRDDRP